MAAADAVGASGNGSGVSAATQQQQQTVQRQQQQQAKAKAVEVTVDKAPPLAPGRLDQTRLKSVVKLFVVKAEPNYAQPWQVRPQRSSTGSGFVIRDSSGKLRVITNAHVVNHSTTVHIRRPGNPKKFPSTVLCVGYICDLALLEVDDDTFYEGMEPLSFSPIPQLQDTVVAVGYPRGGDSCSVTKGVVSRVDTKRYCSGGSRLLCVQIDAAINPGNSGGPAFSRADGSVVGVAFCKLTESDNIGYIIPISIVSHFLREYEVHGRYRGVSAVGFQCQEMENQALRDFHGMTPEQSGVLVYRLDPMHPVAGVLREQDVLLECEASDGTMVPVADDGTISFRGEERVEFSHLFRCRSIGDNIRVNVLREKKRVTLSYELQRFYPLVPGIHTTDVLQGGCTPSYFIIGGLVFVPLSVVFLEQAYGSSWKKSCPVAVQALLPEYKDFSDQQVVVLFQVLSAQLNYGYRLQTVQLKSFNGVEVRNLRHLAELVDGSKDPWLRFSMDGGRSIVLCAEKTRSESAEVLARHAIPCDRSDELIASCEN
jgi:S1-C subfamily serine protease